MINKITYLINYLSHMLIDKNILYLYSNYCKNKLIKFNSTPII